LGIPVLGYTTPDTCKNDSLCWRANFVLEQTWSGVTDTVTIGFDSAGTLGYQSNLDVIDTNFTTPLSILSYDTMVANDQNTCPANMEKDIRHIRDTMRFALYVKADSFNWSCGWGNTDSCVYLKWDTTQLTFNNGRYWLKDIDLYATGGYIDGIDREHIWIKRDSTFKPEQKDEQVAVVWEQNPPEYKFGSCADPDSIVKIEVVLSFLDLESVGVASPSGLKSKITQDRTYKTLNLQARKYLNGEIRIYDITGRLIQSRTVKDKRQVTLDYRAFPPGMYLLNYRSEKPEHHMSRKFIILN
jgi:hypothetical protein